MSNTKKTIIFFCVILVFFFISEWLSTITFKYSAFSGKIVEKFRDTPNHNVAVFKYISNSGVSQEIIEIDDLFDKAEIGDYIIKRRGIVGYTLVCKNNDTLVFNYTK